jgi:uncharacterized protein (DUF2252 family)
MFIPTERCPSAARAYRRVGNDGVVQIHGRRATTRSGAGPRYQPQQAPDPAAAVRRRDEADARRLEAGLEPGDALPPGSAGVIAVYEHEHAEVVNETLANAIRKSTAPVDKTEREGAAEDGARGTGSPARGLSTLAQKAPARRLAVMSATKIEHPSIDERRAKGKETRERTTTSAHAGWRPAVSRPDPVALLEEQDATREPELVPVRHGRMMVSPFTFYRGAAKIMAVDLEPTPRAGLEVQLCGDAHLSNFGVYASPERQLLFDLNDFDETLPGPFEYDLKRMSASFTIAARNNGFGKADAREATRVSVSAYRAAMAEFAEMTTMEVWYAHLSEANLMAAIERFAGASKGKAEKKAAKKKKRAKPKTAADEAKAARKAAEKARTRDSMQALSKLGELVDGRYRIVSQPPIIVPMRDLQAMYGFSAEQLEHAVHEQFRAYRATLQDDRRHLLEQFQMIDMARKVVGVGSVGTRAFIVLLQGRDENDPLFLQVKEATASVLEDHLPKSRYKQPGQRVVQGQRLMQAASDIYLGWTKGEQENRYLYWRQLRDMKGSADVESLAPDGLRLYAQLCAWTLARAHARSGDPIAITAYLGESDEFDKSIVDFSERYADQNERDYEAFTNAVRTGRLEATEGV